MPLKVIHDEFQPSWEEEGLFARDVNGQLVRVVEASEQDYFQQVTVTIDGQAIRVPRAVPATDAQGNIIYLDAAGRTQPRRTTIYDAALALGLADLRKRRGQAAERELLDDAKSRLLRTIPTLCHLDHLAPAGVCRVCSVELAREETDPQDPAKKVYRGSGKLVPACVQPVEDRMFVNTLAGADGQRVRRAVKVLLELLAADHLPAQAATAGQPPTELARLIFELNRTVLSLDAEARQRGRWLTPERFAPQSPPVSACDESSPLIRVDPAACILCDRCARACNDVKQNFVIGRTGKGYGTRIGFDLNDPMGDSSCVECGECMLACPTTALEFREPVEKSDWFLEQVGGQNPLTRQRWPGLAGKSPVTPAEMDASELLRTLPWRYREWNQYAVVRWRLAPGDVLCRAGEYGATAFLVQDGKFAVVPPGGGEPIELASGVRVLGEMTCLNYYPRSATLVAQTSAEVFEVRRNLLFALQRVPESREILTQLYRDRAVELLLRAADWFQELSEADRAAARQFLLEAWYRPRAAADAAQPAGGNPAQPAGGNTAQPAGANTAVRKQVELVQLAPGQVIYREGEHADAFYIIRIGHVKVSQAAGGVLRYLRPVGEFDVAPRGPRSAAAQPSYFGEIGCLADWPEAAAAIPPERRDPRRTATCTALDHVELVRIDRDCFLGLLLAVPALKAEVLKHAARRLSSDPLARAAQQQREPQASGPLRREFVEQGLYNAQRLLVLDLEACTRCDECTKACSDTHQGITRLIREGLRIDKWLVASACRSCSDPYCLVGCPVDAIHRDGQGKQIQIESHCIGCGLCATNCPYGNINMHPRAKGGELHHVATTCDLCSSIVGPANWRSVSCVFACPHNAAFRMTGDELWQDLARR